MRERELARSIVGELIWLAATACVLLGGRWIAFSIRKIGSVSPAARASGNDGFWLSHHTPPLRTGPPTTLYGVAVESVWRIPHSIELVCLYLPPQGLQP